ncbi:MAG: hypothetical protein AB7Q17_16205 [Phycisphaerae bacterium]
MTLERLARATGRVLDAFPQAQSARQLQRTLQLDYALAWQLQRVAGAADPFAAGGNVPRRSPFERFTRAAERRGAPRAAVEAADAAYAAYELCIRRHAGDRGAFDSLIAGLRQDAADAHELRQRRAAFRANAHLWGKSVAARLQLAIYVPDVPDHVDSASVAGWVALTASRANAAMTIPVCNFMRTIDPVEGRAPRIEAGPCQARPIELLAEFSSPGLPDVETVRLSGAREVGNLRLRGVGRASAVTFHLLAVAPHACDDPILGVGTLLRVPSEVLISDVYVAEGFSDPATAELAAYARPDLVDQVTERRPEDRLPAPARVTHVAGIDVAPRTPEVPQYPELVQHLLLRMGWAGRRFDLYRARIEYPLLHGFVELSVRRTSSCAPGS